MSIQGPKKHCVDKLLEQWKDRGERIQALERKIKDLENCLAAVVVDNGEGDCITVTEKTLVEVSNQDLGFAWREIPESKDKGHPLYEVMLCR